jgi:hypothetical protein
VSILKVSILCSQGRMTCAHLITTPDSVLVANELLFIAHSILAEIIKMLGADNCISVHADWAKSCKINIYDFSIPCLSFN